MVSLKPQSKFLNFLKPQTCRRAFSSSISQTAKTASQYAKEPFISKENGEIVAIRSDGVKNAGRAVAQI